MEPMFRWNCWLYERLLNFYPRQLHCQFGSDMVEVFEDLLSEAMEERGAVGIASLWCMALWEIVSVGLPSRLKTTEVLAGALSFMVSSIIAWAFFRAVG